MKSDLTWFGIPECGSAMSLPDMEVRGLASLASKHWLWPVLLYILCGLDLERDLLCWGILSRILFCVSFVIVGGELVVVLRYGICWCCFVIGRWVRGLVEAVQQVVKYQLIFSGDFIVQFVTTEDRSFVWEKSFDKSWKIVW